MKQIARDAAAAADAGRSAHVGRVVAFKGFGGRRAGEALLVYGDGTASGGLLGGIAEPAMRKVRLPAQLIELAVGDADAVAAGLACGGVASVLVSDVAATPRAVWRALIEGRTVALVTRPATESSSAAALAVTPDPQTRTLERHGTLGDERTDDLAVEAARIALRAGRDLSEIRTEEGGATLVVEVFLPSTTLVVVGEGDLAKALAGQAASLGWAAAIEEVLDEPTATMLASLGPSDATVVLSHDPDVDTPALAAALSGAGYVGALGSRHTQAARRERLAALGFDSAAIDRIHGPVGLDIGARTPEETAVAIAAEILAHRSGRSPVSLRTTAGPING